ncbi:UPF0182 family membrane protein [Fusibacter ferrireducens]|uniref:UPF0182 protein ISU02_13940 n=1 Tax=Fusibacter ferrireducens TaxID=2785058 RepID=A0ABR9ZX90_9FIRM|nr:UPF0182 family protein [Fusibacter ferrireducens]MBF4694219.1 UPF0182 family protein [Fusibacter ferrireducens]
MFNPKKNLVRLLIGLVIVVVLLFGKGINLITDFLWFKSIHFESVFLTRLFTKLSLFLPIWLFLGLFLTIYFRMIYKSYLAYPRLHDVTVKKNPIKQYNALVGFAIGAFFSLVITNSLWLDFLKMINGVSFNQTDPIYHLDISFYIFVLPFLRTLMGLLIVFLGLIILGTALLEFILINQRYPNVMDITMETISNSLKGPFLRSLFKKISYLLAFCFLLLSGFYLTNTFELLYSTRGVAFGASYTDIAVTLWSYRTYALLAVVSAALTLFAFHKNKLRLFALGPIMIIVAGIVFSVAGAIVQQLIVEPDEISKETEYLKYNIEFTQKAYNLDAVDLVEYPYAEDLTQTSIQKNDETIKNIRINDARPLKQTFNQIQSIRLYYDFYDIDVDRYKINGEYTQVFITPRELNQYKLDNKAMTWLNQYLKYTHGYGIVMSPVNRVTDEGQPELLFKNIPPITDTDLRITQPEIYFGEQTEKYIIVGSGEKEFDYPSGSDNVETMYSGSDGISLHGLNRLLFAYKEQSLKLLVSNNVTRDSKIIINRNIIERVNAIAPFLKYDSNPYIVLNDMDGKLYWIIDAYTDTPYYPYSQRFDFQEDSINYIRNAVKVVVDAYDGTVHFYTFDDKDPLILTYKHIFPKLFSDREDFPEGLEAHARYPQNLFDLQASVYQKYHVDNPVVFYNGEDVWDLATEKYMDNVQTMASNYVMFKIEDKAEFALIMPYTPKGKPNMTSLLVARNDAPHYGEVFLYRFPKDKTVQGPIMIESRIDQDSLISPQFTLWGQQGSSVLRGNLIVVPIESSLLYVEPIYIQSDNADSLPEMKRVIIAYKDQIVMESTLKAGLDQLFGNKQQQDLTLQTIETLIKQIDHKFELTKESIDELEQLLEELKKQIK